MRYQPEDLILVQGWVARIRQASRSIRSSIMRGYTAPTTLRTLTAFGAYYPQLIAFILILRSKS